MPNVAGRDKRSPSRSGVMTADHRKMDNWILASRSIMSGAPTVPTPYRVEFQWSAACPDRLASSPTVVLALRDLQSMRAMFAEVRRGEERLTNWRRVRSKVNTLR